METKEIWKPIKGYEGLYEVSNLGNVMSLNYNHTGKTKNLKQFKRKNYFSVSLSNEEGERLFSVHRLVAEAFIENPYNFSQVNHKDENPENNSVENLEWCDAKYNCNYGTRTRRILEKTRNGNTSKQIVQLDLYGELVMEWPSAMEAQRNGYNNSHIIQCCEGNEKSHKGFLWKYKEKYDNEKFEEKGYIPLF